MALRRPFLQGDLVEVTPDRFGRRGEAEADYRGWRLRVEGGIPGEAARVRVLHVSKGGPVASGRWVAALEARDDARVDPLCPIHDLCGGCGLQHVSTRRALALKVEQARRTLGERGTWLEPIASPRAFGYRSKTFLLPQRRGMRLKLGVRPPRGQKLVDVTACAVLRPELEDLSERVRDALAPHPELAETLRSVMLRCSRGGATQLTLVHRGGGEHGLDRLARMVAPDAAFLQRHDGDGNRICSDEPELQVVGDAPIRERFGESVTSAVPPTAFVQGNPEVAEALYVAAAWLLEGRRIGELYCGAGTAGLLALAQHPKATLLGVDRSPRAIALARDNAVRHGLDARCAFETRAAEAAGLDCDVLLVNPPRTGCHAAVLDALARSPARRLVYLSCNAETLARDLDLLGWPTVSIQPADMFPQTPHLELLALAERPARNGR